MTMDIVGYEQGGRCDHCGRALRHVVLLADGRNVGATCLAKVMTKPRETHGVDVLPTDKSGGFYTASDESSL